MHTVAFFQYCPGPLSMRGIKGMVGYIDQCNIEHTTEPSMLLGQGAPVLGSPDNVLGLQNQAPIIIIGINQLQSYSTVVLHMGIMKAG